MRFAACVLGAIAAFLSFPHALAEFPYAALPRLYTNGAAIYRSDSDRPVILRGAVSDYFRYSPVFGVRVRQAGLDAELGRVAKLHDAGGNVIGLYLADTNEIEANLPDLDRYIAYATSERMYVYFMPVAREFNGRKDPGDASANLTFADLTRLMDTLSKRYGNRPNVLYGFGAEPDGDTAQSWDAKERTLAAVVRKNAPEAVLLVTGADYGPGFTDHFSNDPFPYANAVYASGGYVADASQDLAGNPSLAENRIATVEKLRFASTHPYLASEFGGFSSHDLSNAEDLGYVARLLTDMDHAGMSYTMYRLSSDHPDDALALFTEAGEPTKRGAVFFTALSTSPPTAF